MDKSRKLKLKRKPLSKINLDRVDLDKTCSALKSNVLPAKDLVPEVTVILSSDEDVSPSKHKDTGFGPLVSAKTSSNCADRGGKSNKEENTSFQDVSDPELNHLRHMIMKTFRCTHDVSTLPELPPFKTKTTLSTESQDLVKLREKEECQELSPLPARCVRCFSKKTSQYSRTESLPLVNGLSGLTAEKMDSKPLPQPCASFQTPTAKTPNLSSNGYLHFSSDKRCFSSSASHTYQHTAECSKPQTSNCDNNDIDQTASLAGSSSNKTSPKQVTIGVSPVTSHQREQQGSIQNSQELRNQLTLPFSEDSISNSHLMKDRNSNYYVLQSRNGRNSTNSSDANVCRTTTKSREVDTTSHDSKVNPLHKQASLTLKASLILKENKFKNESCPSSKRPTETTHSDYDDTQTQLKSKRAKVSSSAVCSTENQDKHVPRPEQNVEGEKNTRESALDVRIKNCPLCQQEFEDSQNQLDIDGHIALCLSGTNDDLVW